MAGGQAAVALVALLTDFGDSEYTGIVKGVLHRLCPGVAVVDLTHTIAPQQVREGAWVLLTAYRWFPPGTVFLCVVDPGVGTARAAVAVAAGDYFFVGPDNGLLYPAVADAGFRAAVQLAVPPGASATFHGRDVFAPAAARLAGGAALADLGGPAPPLQPLQFHRQGREGEVVRVDRFGNVTTNLPPEPGQWRYRVTLGTFQAELPLVPTYAHGPETGLFLVVGSAGTLELAVKNGSAAALLPAAAPGVRVVVA